MREDLFFDLVHRNYEAEIKKNNRAKMLCRAMEFLVWAFIAITVVNTLCMACIIWRILTW